MIKVKLADVVVQVHVRDEYSWQRVLHCPWVNCKYYNDTKCNYKDNYNCNCCNFVFMNGHTYCQKYTKE